MAIRNGAKAIILNNGKVLLNKCIRENGDIYYDLPGGGQNQFETIEEAVVRECMEETGFAVRPIRFAALAEEIYDDETLRKKYIDYSHRILHIFIVELVNNVRHEATETDFDQEESQWINVEDIPLLDIRPSQLKGNFKRIIESESPVYLGSVHVL